MKSLQELNVHKQMVFVRVDFNVPLDANQNITEDARIIAALPTLEYLIKQKAKIIVASHLGRPKGKIVSEMRMTPVAKRLSELLGQEVQYVQDCIGPEVEQAKAALQPGEILLLENLRFYSEEKENDIHFAEQLATGIQVYVAEGFGVVHRKHASTYGLPSLIFDKGIGFLIEKELNGLRKVMDNPEKPLVLVIGGMKISDKVDVVRNLAPMSNIVLVGGGVANTFLKARGIDIGGSVVDSDSVSAEQEGVSYVDVAGDIWDRFKDDTPTVDVELPEGVAELTKIQAPIDFIAAPNTDEGAETRVVNVGEPVPEGWLFLDIGPKTEKLYADILSQAKTIFWNGPLGLFEMDAYASGSRAVAEAIANVDGYTVLGGGDTVVVTEQCGLKGKYSHTSTGGGASLAFLAKKELPGLAALGF